MKRAVGPVLESGDVALALLAALRERNAGLQVLDRGAYLRVSVPGRCVLRREDVERSLGRPFRLPGDLEMVMPSFAGRIRVDDDEVVWELT